MAKEIKRQGISFIIFYLLFALVGFVLIMYYLSNTIWHYTTSQQFPISSFSRFPLTYLIFPAEIFSFLFSLYFVYNLVNGNSEDPKPKPLPQRDSKAVAILIPVYNEPKDIVLRTLMASKAVRWAGGTKLYLLDDSTDPGIRRDMEELSRRFSAKLVRRNDRKGYKAGNINNAVSKHIEEEYFAILDSDQAPEPEFLEETMDYFSDPKVGFVQTPQHFININSPIERAQELGTNIFYQAQSVSKARDHAMPFCGTNVVVRTKAFKEVKGFAYYTATEDIELGLRLNEAGYFGAYVAKNLVNGYATVNFKAYASQQYRWANGNLAILRKNWLRILFGRFSLRQQIHTLFTIGWWLVGAVSLIYILVPILSFFLGGTHHTWLPTSLLALLFLNVGMGISMIFASLSQRVAGERITIKDAMLQYSLITNSMFIYIWAAINVALGRYVGFVRTNKQRQSTGIRQILLNLLLSAACFGFSIYALYKSLTTGSIDQLRKYLPLSLWLIFYSIVLASSILFVERVRARAGMDNDKEITPRGDLA